MLDFDEVEKGGRITGEIDCETGKKTAFKGTEKDTAGDKTLEILDNTGEGRNDAP